MSSIVPTISGPKRPQDKVLLSEATVNFKKFLKTQQKETVLNLLKFREKILKSQMVQF